MLPLRRDECSQLMLSRDRMHDKSAAIVECIRSGAQCVSTASVQIAAGN